MQHRFLPLTFALSLALPAVADNTYGPTRDQETLWSIASRLKPSDEVSVQQIALALYQKNPQAFDNKNINTLKNDVVLQTPTIREMQSVSRIAALRETKRHNTAWETGAVTTTTPKPVRPSPNHPVKIRPTVKIVKVVADAPRRSSATASVTIRKQQEAEIKTLKRKVNTLTQELANAQAQSRQLSKQLKSAQNKPSKPASPTTVIATAPAVVEVEVARKVQKLSAQVKELESVLEEKNNHIHNLEASLKNASATIKRQHSENQQLHGLIQAGTAATATTAGTPATGETNAPQLKLTDVPDPKAATTTPATNTEPTGATATEPSATTGTDSTAPDVPTTPETSSATNPATPADAKPPAEATTPTSVTPSTPTPTTPTGQPAEIPPTTAPVAPSPFKDAQPQPVSPFKEPAAPATPTPEVNVPSVAPSPFKDAQAQPTANAVDPASQEPAPQNAWAEVPKDQTQKPTLQPTNDVRNTTTQPLNAPTNGAISGSVAQDLNLPAKVAEPKPLFGSNGSLPPPSNISYVVGGGVLAFIGFLWWRARRDKRAQETELPNPEKRRQNLRQDPLIEGRASREAKAKDTGPSL